LVWKCLFSELGPPLSRALADLRAAVFDPHDTAFHCYRALETLAWTFAEPTNSEQQLAPKDWASFRAAVRVPEESMKKLARLRRIFAHGRARHVTGEEREKVLQFAWGVVDRLIFWKAGRGEFDADLTLDVRLDEDDSACQGEDWS